MGRAKYVVELAEEERVRLRSLAGWQSFRSHGDQGTGPIPDLAAALDRLLGWISQLLKRDWSIGNSRDRDSDGSSVGSKKPM